MSTGTVRLHRVLKTTPAKLYKAFLDADALARWIPPYGFLCRVHQFEPKVGGKFRMSFLNFGTGKGHSFGVSTSSWSRTRSCATRTCSTTRTSPAR
jgi:uncharacterized protein YndB with AHSA1/START domain